MQESIVTVNAGSIPSPQERQADTVIVGAGAAGLFAALVAARRGASVLLLERDLGGPSNLLVSGGLFPGAGSRLQRAGGVEDSAEQFAADVTAKAQGIVDAPVLAAIARQTAPAIHFLIDEAGLPVKWLPDLQVPGHSVPRMHATPNESGRELHRLLREAIGRVPGIRLVADAEGCGLLSTDGRVIGAQARIGGQVIDFHARSVLLATGGFASNPALLAEYIPEVAGALHIGAGANDGCSVQWGRSLGADVAFMQGYQGQGHVNPGGKTRLGMALPSLGAFMVNREGRRFIAEDIGPSELAAFVLGQPGGVALEIFDQRIHDLASRQGPYREACEAGHVREADTPEALAQAFGLPVETFAKTFADFCRFVQEGHDPEMGRKRFGPMLQTPLRAAWVTGALAHTQGGLRIDVHGQVVTASGAPIPGLLAAGGAAASISGIGGAGYLPGNGLAQSFGLGLICGETIARPARTIA
jgi:fumarate reductase flavoprotein subunit